MKLFIKLFFFVVAQRLFLETIFAQQLVSGGGNGSDGGSAISGKHVGDSGNDLFGTQLLADPVQTSAVGQKDGEDVKFVGQGYINLTLRDDGLVFQIRTSCLGSVYICYESLNLSSALRGDCSSSQCFLQIEGRPAAATPAGQTPGSIVFRPDAASYPVLIPGIIDYGEIAIKGVPVLFKDSANIKTCHPNKENGIIRLLIKTFSDTAETCQLKAIGAKIKYPEIVTTPKPPTSPYPPSSTPAPPKPDSTDDSSFPVWAIVLIVVGLLLVMIGVGVLVYCCLKKRPSSKSPVSPDFEAPLTVVTRNDAKESTVSTQAQPPSKQDPKVVKAELALPQEPVKKTVEKDAPTVSKEPVKMQHVENKAVEKKHSKQTEKKVVEKKKTTIEQPTTTEEVAPPAPQKPAPYNYPPPHVVPRSYPGSHRTSSVEDAIERNKLIPVESVADSLARNCIKPGDTAIVGKMKKNYPEVMRVRWRHEIVLFCIAISEMFQTLNDMADEYEEVLNGLGVIFDAQHRIVSVTSEARQYILDPSKPGTCALFAFGAEYHQYVTDDMKLMHKFSVPHLMAIALQPRFPDYHRRKACTWLRRELPKIRENYSVAERKAMPFPISIIEEAFILDPKYLLDTAGLDTDSEADRRKYDEAQKEWLKKKNEGRGADGKRKKKSSKKRQ